LRVGKLRVACHAAALTRVFVQDSSVRVSPVRLDKDGERRAASIAACTYDRDTQVLRIDVPKNEGAVEFLIRVLPLFLAGSEFADN
jgi:hypothetical protein